MNAQVAKQIRQSRREQGLPETIEDATLLELLAAEIQGTEVAAGKVAA